MQSDAEQTISEQEPLYFASCYISKQYREIIFSVMRVEFVDQLCEHEPVIAFGLDAHPNIVGLAVKAILAESNQKSAKANPLLSTRLANIPQGKIFYDRSDYTAHQTGRVYYDRPGYQASSATILHDFSKHYLHFLVQATDETILATLSFNEWNPLQYSERVPLGMDDEGLGALFLGFSRLCI